MSAILRNAWLAAALLALPAAWADPAGVYYVDGATGDDSAAGNASAPWKTILHAAQTVVAGETVKVRAGVYSELATSYPNSGVKGIKPKNSGTASAPITFEAKSGDLVIIDQQGVGAGFYIQGRDHIVIRGFEIRNALKGGIWTTVDGQTGIIIEDNTIHHVDGQSGENIAAVKIDGCDQCLVRNNTLHDVRVNGQYQVNGAGVHSYDMAATTVSGNKIWNAYTGIFHKRSTGGAAVTLENNEISEATIGILFSVGGSGDPAHIGPQVIGNRFSAVETAVSTTTYETATASHGLVVAGNRFAGGDGILLWGMRDVTITDNEFINTNIAIRTIYNEARPAGIAESDLNYFPGNASFVRNEWSGMREEYASLDAWQSATGFDTGSSTATRPTDPGDPPPDDPPPDDGGDGTVGAYFSELFAQYVGQTIYSLQCLGSTPPALPGL